MKQAFVRCSNRSLFPITISFMYYILVSNFALYEFKLNEIN